MLSSSEAKGIVEGMADQVGDDLHRRGSWVDGKSRAAKGEEGLEIAGKGAPSRGLSADIGPNAGR